MFPLKNKPLKSFQSVTVTWQLKMPETDSVDLVSMLQQRPGKKVASHLN